MIENSAMVAVLRWCVRTIGEPDYAVKKSDDELSFEHPVIELLQNPNPSMTGAQLRSAITGSLVMTGQGYITKVSGLKSQPVELWPLIPGEVELIRDTNGTPTHYMYRQKRIDLENMIHIRDGSSPIDPIMGWGGLESVVREIATDTEATKYTAAILANLGVPGVVISLKDTANSEIDPEVAEEIKQTFRRNFGGEKRGEAMVITVPVDLQMPGFSPDKMALDLIRKVPERRICAVVGIPPIVAGLGEDPKYDNYRAAREAAYESWAVPMWRLIERSLTAGLADMLDGAELVFDISKVRAFQEDTDAAATRWASLYTSDLCTRNEARKALGLAELPGEDSFSSQGSTGRASTLNALRNKPRGSRSSSQAGGNG
jgi:HK97 family phage portal protein